MKAICNAKIISPKGLLTERTLLFDEKITAVIPDNEISSYNIMETFDAKGCYVSAGFIDIHVHGCAGSDTMDSSFEALENMSRMLATTGVTAFLPTTMTVSFDDIEKAIQNIGTYMGRERYAEILGCHMEGPFISEKYKGAQNSDFILKPDFNKIKHYKDIIKIVTLAPELEGSEAFIKACRDRQIVVSIGHSEASYEEAQNAFEWGSKHVTHTFNAMTPLHHRKPGTAGAAMSSNATCELVVDNKHLHTAIPEIMLKIKGIDKIILVTDAVRACMMEDGEYELGGQAVILKDEAVRLPNGVLAGSVLTLNKALKNFVNDTGINVAEAIKTVTANPAKLLNIEEHKGSIEPGKDADLTIFNEDFCIRQTFVKGRIVYGGQI